MTDEPRATREAGREEQCGECGGQGYWIATHYVTRDMATDAGEPSMEGMPMEERVPCNRCGGGGVILLPAQEESP